MTGQRLLGIMQGRLVPPVEGRFQAFPRDRWTAEFPRAAEAGLGVGGAGLVLVLENDLKDRREQSACQLGNHFYLLEWESSI